MLTLHPWKCHVVSCDFAQSQSQIIINHQQHQQLQLDRSPPLLSLQLHSSSRAFLVLIEKMRSRLINQMPKAIRSSGSSSAKQGRSTPLASASARSPTQSIHQQPSTSMMQQRLFGTNTINMVRTAVGVEGCSIALSLVLEGVVVEPNLPRGWDAGVAVDDDGG